MNRPHFACKTQKCTRCACAEICNKKLYIKPHPNRTYTIYILFSVLSVSSLIYIFGENPKSHFTLAACREGITRRMLVLLNTSALLEPSSECSWAFRQLLHWVGKHCLNNTKKLLGCPCCTIRWTMAPSKLKNLSPWILNGERYIAPTHHFHW